MYLDIPKLTRCCFCVPLRRGVLTFGYLNLMFTLIGVGVVSYVIDVGRGDAMMMLYRGHTFPTSGAILIAVYLIDVAFNVILIVGGHKKNVLLLWIYFYYGLTTTIAVFVLDIGLMWNSIWFFEELCLLFSGIVLQGYLLLLVKNEIDKLNQASHPVQFVNRLTEIVVTDRPAPDTDTRTLVDGNKSQEFACSVAS